MKKIIIIAAGVVLLVGITVGAMLFLRPAPPATEAQDGEAPAEAADAKSVKQDPPIYVELNPEFVAAFQNPKQSRFIKAAIQVMTRDSHTEEAIKLHNPVIRDSIITIFSNKDSEQLISPEGKGQFRAELLAVIQQVLEENTGEPGIEAVYFTSFIIQ